MAYRVASDPWEKRPIRPPDAHDRPERRRRLLHRVAVIAGTIGPLMLMSVGASLVDRPRLAPDVSVPSRPPFEYRYARPFEWAPHSGCGRDTSERPYDVDRALLSDEPMDPEVEPEGSGPARRRYVRPSASEGAAWGVTLR